MADQKKLYGGSKAVAKCYQPFANVELANTAVQSFISDLYDLRVKYGISDVLVTIMDSVIGGDDDIGTVMLHSHFGQQDRSEVMAAYTFGRVQEERQQRVMSAASTKAIHTTKSGT